MCHYGFRKCEQGSSDHGSDCEDGENQAENEISCEGSDGAGPGCEHHWDEPGGELGEISFDVVCGDCTYFKHIN